MAYRHIPVMRSEVLEYLNCRPGKIYVDGTLGGAGHARDICERIMPDGLLIGIDQDPAAIANAGIVLEPFAARVRLVHENFAQLPHVLSQLGITGVDGILLDLGLSLNQLENSGRGFSFQREEPLDMRMDPRAPETAADLVNGLAEDELRRIFQEYGEERFSGRIARRIAAERRRAPVPHQRRVGPHRLRGSAGARLGPQPDPPGHAGVHGAAHRRQPGTRAPRGVPGPGAALPEPRGAAVHPGLSLAGGSHREAPSAGPLARPSTRVAVCGEPSSACRASLKVLTKKVLRPGPEEIAANPMARSTRLRAAERV